MAVVDGNVLLSVGEVGFEPGEGSSGDADGGLKAGDEDGMVDGVKSSTEVEENENSDESGVRG